MSRTIEEVLEDLQKVVDGANDRSLTDEEVRSYEGLEAELATLREDTQVRARHDAYLTRSENPLTTGTVQADPETDLERAFSDFMRTGKENQDIVELRDQSIGTNTAGGYTVPTGFRNKIIDRMKAFGGIGNVVENITTETGNTLPWPTVDDTANLGAIVAEAGTFSAGADIVFGTKSIGAYKYAVGGAGTTPLRVSRELLQDSAIDVQALIANKLGERIARIQSAHLVTGTGTGQPQGITSGLTPVQAGQNTGLKYDDIVNYIHSVDPAYRSGAQWAFNDNSLAVLEKMKDAAGDPLWSDATSTDSALGFAGRFKGYPVTIDQAFPDYVPNSATVIWGVFGNLREGYLKRNVKEITLIVNPWTRASNFQMEYSAWARMDATQQNTFAYKGLTGKV